LFVLGSTDGCLKVLGGRATMFDPLLHNTVNATIVRGGDKVNVIPGEVELTLDARLLPGFGPDELRAELAAVVGEDVELEVDRFDEGGPAEPDMGLWDVLSDAIRDGDSGIKPIPYLMPAVSDGRHFTRLGIQNYGFTPMRLPEGFEFTKLIHAADERIPVDAVEFGTDAYCRVLERFQSASDQRRSKS
jgi:acetylornithine deacetylase/succinyl-diaminopimelate desuccinylase-like protein